MNANRRKCSYCQQTSVLTNEHVFPECFSKTFNAITTTVTPTGEKAIASDLQIGDVCAICNNEKLSQLDIYLCYLNDLYFSKIIHAGDRVKFAHEPDKTLRTLLKIGFNVARARKWPLEIWSDSESYILGSSPRPSGFRVFLQLMIPTPVGETKLVFGRQATEVPPMPMRVYSMDMAGFPGIEGGYSLSVWSYRFFILRESFLTPVGVRRMSIVKWLRNNWGAVELVQRRSQTLCASSVKVLEDAEGNSIFREQLNLVQKLKVKLEHKTPRR